MQVYVGAIFLLSAIAGIQCQCPSHWFPREDVCFFISEVPADFDDARTECRRLGGDLATIEDVVKNGIIKALHSGFTNLLVGLQFVPKIGWRWPDGKVVSFENWLTAPILNTFPPSCVIVDELGRWLSVPCSDKFVYVCEKMLAPVILPVAVPLVPLVTIPVPPPPPAVGRRSVDDATTVAPVPADPAVQTTTATPPVTPIIAPIPNLTPSPAIPVSTDTTTLPPSSSQPLPPGQVQTNPLFTNFLPPPFPFNTPFSAFPKSPFQSMSQPFPSGMPQGSGVGISVVQDASGKVDQQHFVWTAGDKNKPEVIQVKS